MALIDDIQKFKNIIDSERKGNNDMKTMKFYDEHTGEPYFCVVSGRGHKIRRVASIGEGDSWIAEIRDLMDRDDVLGLGERLVQEIDLAEDLEVSDDDIEMSVIHHAYLATICRYRVIEALEARKMEQAQTR